MIFDSLPYNLSFFFFFFSNVLMIIQLINCLLGSVLFGLDLDFSDLIDIDSDILGF